jgi:hypothetical protein
MDFKQYLHKTMSYKLIESVEYSPTKESTNFLSKFGIDDEKLDYLGSGDYGTAYSVGNNKVLKITSSKSEYELAKQIMNGNFKHIVKIYAVEKINNDYFILQEELIIKSNIEDKWNEMMNMLQSQDLPVQYIDNFDEDEYEETNISNKKTTTTAKEEETKDKKDDEYQPGDYVYLLNDYGSLNAGEIYPFIEYQGFHCITVDHSNHPTRSGKYLSPFKERCRKATPEEVKKHLSIEHFILEEKDVKGVDKTTSEPMYAYVGDPIPKSKPLIEDVHSVDVKLSTKKKTNKLIF